jgi:hypothetical protein
LKKQNPIKSKD